MKKLSVLFLSIFAICLSSCAVVVDDFWDDWDDDDEEVHFRYEEIYYYDDYSDDMSSIEIDWYNGPVKVVRTNKSYVYCQERACSNDGSEREYGTCSGGNLFISFCCLPFRPKTYKAKELIVFIPVYTNVRTVRVHNRCGDVTIEGCCRCNRGYHYNDGLEVDPICDNGQVRVSECK